MLSKTCKGLYLSLAVIMAIATVTTDSIYTSWWFIALWAMLVASGITYIAHSRMRKPSALCLHAAFIVILSGALVTHIWGTQGVLYVTADAPSNALYTPEGVPTGETLPFSVQLRDFNIEYYEDSADERDYHSSFIIFNGSERIEGSVSMNRIFTYDGVRLYQTGYDADELGVYLSVNHDPWGIGITYVGYALLFFAFVWILLDPKGQYRSLLRQSAKAGIFMRKATIGLGVILGTVCCVVVYLFVAQYDESNHILPVLRSPLLPLHVSTIILAYLLLLIETILCIVSLIAKRNLGRGLLLYPAMALLSVGIFVGAIWANVSWGNYWSWDPKETWALITMMTYAVPFHRISVPQMQNQRFYQWYMLFAIITIAMTYFGVNYFLAGMHSYA